jgi:hypothetical protein
MPHCWHHNIYRAGHCKAASSKQLAHNTKTKRLIPKICDSLAEDWDYKQACAWHMISTCRRWPSNTSLLAKKRTQHDHGVLNSRSYRDHDRSDPTVENNISSPMSLCSIFKKYFHVTENPFKRSKHASIRRRLKKPPSPTCTGTILLDKYIQRTTNFYCLCRAKPVNAQYHYPWQSQAKLSRSRRYWIVLQPGLLSTTFGQGTSEGLRICLGSKLSTHSLG